MRFLRKFNNIHFLSLFANGSMTVINMVAVAILYRFLPIEATGTWIFYQTWVLFVDAFRTGLLNTAFVKYYSGASGDRKKEVVGSSWYIITILTLFIIILNVPAWFILQNSTQAGVDIFLKYLAINMIVTMPNLVAGVIAQGELKFDRLLYIRVFNNGLFLLVLIGLLVTGNLNLHLLIYFNLAAITLANLFSLLSGWSGIQYFKYKTKSCAAEIFNFGKYTVGTFISTSLFRITDTTFLTLWLGPSALAIYNLGQKLMEVVELPIRSLMATAMPSMSARYNQNDKEGTIYVMKKYIGMITLGLVPVLFISIFLADFAISLIGGGKYANTEAANVFRMFMFFSLISPADRFMATAIDVINKPNINFIKLIFIIIINLLGDYISVMVTKSVYGIALANVLPGIFAVIAGYYALQKYYMKFSLLDAYKVGFIELKLLASRFISKKNTIVDNI